MANAQRRRAFWKPQRVSATNYPAASLEDARTTRTSRPPSMSIGDDDKRSSGMAGRETKIPLQKRRHVKRFVGIAPHLDMQPRKLPSRLLLQQEHWFIFSLLQSNFRLLYPIAMLPVLHHRCTTMNGTSTSSSSASDVTTSKIKCFFHDGTGFFPISA